MPQPKVLPYVGEIRMFAGSFAPVGWMFCEGQLLPASGPEYEALFELIGTRYGGDGQSTFALPDLRGRIPIHQGKGFGLAGSGGGEEVTLAVNQLPAHSHSLAASTAAALNANPSGNVLGNQTLAQMYVEDVANASLSPAAMGPFGASQPHSNVQPYLCLNFIIALNGIFPSPT